MKMIAAALTSTAVAGVLAAGLLIPSATASKDPCTASEVARTLGSVVTSIGDYLDSHPDANQAVTAVLQQPAGPESTGKSIQTLNTYFGANPKVQGELVTVAEPLSGLATKCQLPVSIPALLALIPAAQSAPGFPGPAPMLVR